MRRARGWQDGFKALATKSVLNSKNEQPSSSSKAEKPETPQNATPSLGWQELTLPYPPSANRIWRTGRGKRTYLAPEATAFKAGVDRLARQARVQCSTLPIEVHLYFYRPRRSGDLDNRIKVVFDALNGIAWHDDKQVCVLKAWRFDDKDNPRAVVSWRAAGGPEK